MSTEPLLLEARSHDLGGGFLVRRAIPHAKAREVGPFVFFDHMGPVQFAPGHGVDVRPHPHIGLATVTYLFEGAMTHRDSLGMEQVIRPGDVNWMTAGRGIAHSERSPAPERAAGQRLHGIQIWIGLPQQHEEIAPEFHHHPAASLPSWNEGGVALRLIAGSYAQRRSPVATYSPMFYLAAEFSAGSGMVLDSEHAQRAVYVAAGTLRIGELELAVGQTLVLPGGVDVLVSADEPAIVMFYGGAPLDGQRFVWWNFVASSRERIERAKEDWRAQRFARVPGETEFIPLPDK